MKMIWHIFKKDFVHLRLALGLWVLVLASEAFFHRLLLAPAGVDAGWFIRAQMYVALFTVISLVVGYLMIASLVLEDPLIGTRMFWATRPISGGQLLGAKLLGIFLLFGVLPILVRLPWWFYCGYGWRELGGAAMQNFLSVGVLAVPAVVLAALSGQSSRFLLYSLLLIVVLPIETVVLKTRPDLNSDLFQSRMLLALLLCWISGSVAAVVQFLTRRLVRSVPILAGGVIMATLVLFTWPWLLDRLWPDDTAQLTGTESVSAEILTAAILPAGNGNLVETTPVWLTLQIKNLPAHEVLLWDRAEVGLHWPDGFAISQTLSKSNALDPADCRPVRRLLTLSPSDPETVKKPTDPVEEPAHRFPTATKSTGSPPPPADNETRLSLTLLVTPEVAERIRVEPPACSISIRMAMGRPTILLEMPMQSGASQAGDGVRLQVIGLEDVESKDGPGQQLAKKYNLTLVSATAATISKSIYRIDRQHGDCELIQNGAAFGPFPYTVGTRIVRLSNQLSPRRIWRNDQWISDPDWLAAQRLVVVSYREEGGFNREIHVDHLPLRKASAK